MTDCQFPKKLILNFINLFLKNIKFLNRISQILILRKPVCFTIRTYYTRSRGTWSHYSHRVKMVELEKLCLEPLIKEKIDNELWTHVELSAFLNNRYPGRKGFSVRSLERFCSAKRIHRTGRVGTECLDVAVSDAIAKVHV